MGREEQKEEREVLDSIFPEEITDVSDMEYRISMLLDIPSDDAPVLEEGEEGPTAPIILLTVRYPENYPDEAPMLDISQPPNMRKHQHLDIQTDKARLLEELQPSIEENLGIAMVFTLYSTLKEAAEQLVAERAGAVQAEIDLKKRQAEEEENRKFEGEKVTRETFLTWRNAFKQEIQEEKMRKAAEVEAEDKKKRSKVEEKKLTGKQLWEQGLAGKSVEEEEDGEDAIAHGLRQVKVEG